MPVCALLTENSLETHTRFAELRSLGNRRIPLSIRSSLKQLVLDGNYNIMDLGGSGGLASERSCG